VYVHQSELALPMTRGKSAVLHTVKLLLLVESLAIQDHALKLILYRYYLTDHVQCCTIHNELLVDVKRRVA
jgi:hypothetical protein